MWYCGDVEIDGLIFYYIVKVYDKPSAFGINYSRISKLELKLESYGSKELQAYYDRGWVTKPTTIYAEKAVEYLLKRFN